MYFNRLEAKMAAKASVRLCRPHPMLVTLVFALLTFGVSFAAVFIGGGPYVEIVERYAMGYDLEQVIWYVFQTEPVRCIVFLVMTLVLYLYVTVMTYGYTSYSLRLARNEQPGIANLFDGFPRLGRVLWQSVLIVIFSNLWVLPLRGPAYLLEVLALKGLFSDSILPAMSWIHSVLIYASNVVAIVVSLRYALATFFLVDDPSCTARESIRRSKLAMKGHKWELFQLGLSFFGWLILGAFTLGILYLWVYPYMRASVANFYDYVTGGLPPIASGDRIGPDYDYHASDGPAPF